MPQKQRQMNRMANDVWLQPVAASRAASVGRADVGEVPSEMVAREVREESGLEVAVHKVIGVYDANRGGRPVNFYHAYKIVFLAAGKSHACIARLCGWLRFSAVLTKAGR